MSSYEFDLFGYDVSQEIVHTGSNVSTREVSAYSLGLTSSDPSPGRRLRVFSCLINSSTLGNLGLPIRGMSVVDAYDTISTLYRDHPSFNNLPLRSSSIVFHSKDMVIFEEGSTLYLDKEYRQPYEDPSIHMALQDLAWTLSKDLTEACYAFQDPDVWYPGVDEGIDPVPDSHVDLVIWGAQRELNRELRRSKPAAQLSLLPRRIQRAYAERRRLRYLQWGITKEVWRSGVWSLWDVPEDPEWIPPWI